MSELMLAALKLVVVLGIQKTDSGSMIAFQGGQAGLQANQADYPYFLKLAQRSLERKHPVGVAISGNEIVEMVRADSDVVSQLIPDEVGGLLKIWFLGHDGTYIVRSGNAEFRRLAMMLRTSFDKKQQVWFVARKPSLEIQDVAPLQ
jgi:hypothetical protein